MQRCFIHTKNEQQMYKTISNIIYFNFKNKPIYKHTVRILGQPHYTVCEIKITHAAVPGFTAILKLQIQYSTTKIFTTNFVRKADPT